MVILGGDAQVSSRDPQAVSLWGVPLVAEQRVGGLVPPGVRPALQGWVPPGQRLCSRDAGSRCVVEGSSLTRRTVFSDWATASPGTVPCAPSGSGQRGDRWHRQTRGTVRECGRRASRPLLCSSFCNSPDLMAGASPTAPGGRLVPHTPRTNFAQVTFKTDKAAGRCGSVD